MEAFFKSDDGVVVLRFTSDEIEDASFCMRLVFEDMRKKNIRVPEYTSRKDFFNKFYALRGAAQFGFDIKDLSFALAYIDELSKFQNFTHLKTRNLGIFNQKVKEWYKGADVIH